MIEGITLQYVCEKAAQLPCAPDLLPQVLIALDDPFCDAQKIAEMIMRDQGAASSVLRLANSAMFSRSKCESLTEAFLRLGNDQIFRLISGGVVGRSLSNPVEGYGWENGDLCAHSFTVAICADIIAKLRNFPKPEIAYTAGILHDIGKLGMAHSCGAHFDLIRKRQEESTPMSWRMLEREIFDFDHTEVGSCLLRKWKYPPSLAAVVAYYPKPRNAPEAHRELVLMIHAAKNLAINLGYGVGEDGFRNELDEEMLLQAGYTPEVMEAMIPKIVHEMEKITGPDGKITIAGA